MIKVIKDLTVEENDIDDSLTIRFVKTLRRNIKSPASVILSKRSLSGLIKIIEDYLSSYEHNRISTGHDFIKISGGGTNASPEIMISSKHVRNDGKEESHTLFIPEKAGPALVKVLEKIDKKKESKSR